jgi:hypothetical protein
MSNDSSAITSSADGCSVNPPHGLYGNRAWDEKRNKATKINGDLDEFLMMDVMPSL